MSVQAIQPNSLGMAVPGPRSVARQDRTPLYLPVHAGSPELANKNKTTAPNDYSLVDAYDPQRDDNNPRLGAFQRWCLKQIAGYQKNTRYRNENGEIKNNLGYVCPYDPSCSNYTAQAIREKGALIGIMMGIFRLMRCNPCMMATRALFTGKIPTNGSIPDPVHKSSPSKTDSQIAASNSTVPEINLTGRPEVIQSAADVRAIETTLAQPTAPSAIQTPAPSPVIPIIYQSFPQSLYPSPVVQVMPSPQRYAPQASWAVPNPYAFSTQPTIPYYRYAS